MKTLEKLAMAALLAIGAIGAASTPALAREQTVILKGDVMHELVTTSEAGETSVELVEPSTIVPGDRLVFGTDYANEGNELVKNFVVVNPIPQAVRLAPDSDPDLEVSVDGGTTWGQLANLTVPGGDGSPRAAAHADVTHIRWTLPLVPPRHRGRLAYTAIIR